MKAEDLRTKTPDELSQTLLDLKKQQFNLRFQMSQGQLSNSAQVRTLRRNIARVHTLMNPADTQSTTAPDKAKATKEIKAMDKPKVKKPAKKTAAE